MMYLEDYIELIQPLSTKIQERFSDLRDHDDLVQDIMVDIEERQEIIFSGSFDATTGNEHESRGGVRGGGGQGGGRPPQYRASTRKYQRKIQESSTFWQNFGVRPPIILVSSASGRTPYLIFVQTQNTYIRSLKIILTVYFNPNT